LNFSQTTQDTQQSTVESQSTDLTYDPEQATDLDTTGDLDRIDCDSKNSVTDITEQSVDRTAKYLVFENDLLKLFLFCPNCKSCISSLTKKTTGSMLTVTYTCANGHENVWHSQPVIRRMPAGNLLLSSAIVLSGNTLTDLHFFGYKTHTSTQL
jgi:hypothetical protein